MLYLRIAQFQRKTDRMYDMEDMKDMEALENIKKRSYSIFKGLQKTALQQKEKKKKKTAESQTKERGSALKPASNEFMESVLETH